MDPPPFENDRYAPKPEPAPQRPKLKWYRFTLRRFFVAFVLLSSVFAYMRYTHWGYVAGETITRMGRGIGLVSPPDPSKIRVTAVRPFGVMDYEWRISIPAGQQYLIRRSENEIPREGFPETALSSDFPEESIISFGIQHRGYLTYLSTGIRDCQGFVPAYKQNHLQGVVVKWTKGDLQTSGILYKDGEQEFEPGERIVLIRSMITERQIIGGETLSIGDGIMIWLEPAPP